MVKGLPTASVSKILGTGTYLWKVNYYDEEGQLIVAKAQNNLNGTDEYYNYYNFSGVIDSLKRINAANSVTTTLREYYVYDHAGRLITTKQRINDQTPVILSSVEYNELGQVISKKLHSIDNGANYLQTIDYAFNEQGWLKSINNIGISHSGNTKFGQELKYDDGSVPQYNGNISESKWKVARTSTSPQLGYKYSYDKLDRLTAAVSSTSGTDNGNYNENAAYDNLGNVRKLNRYALLSGVREKIDSLSYDYEGGRHVKIDDLSGSSSGIKALGFNDQVQQATEYVYDGNGRLVSDVNKGITAVAYNAANLPDEITWTSTKKLAYIYNAEGEKLQKKYVDGSVTMITAYNRGIEYVGTHVNSLQLQYVQTSEGRAWFNGSEFIYEYNLTDHLGNVRATIDADPSDVTQRTARLVQENSYYPFGMVMPGADINYTAGNKNNYLYTGKELQEELGEYDHGARFYDPAIARWSVADPLAEQFYGVSPYNYVFNNPMAFTDPTGMYPDDPKNPRVPNNPNNYPVTQDPNDPNMYTWYDPIDKVWHTFLDKGERPNSGRASADAQTAARAAARDAAFRQRERMIAGKGWNSEWFAPETEEDRISRERQAAEAKSRAVYSSKRGTFGQNAQADYTPLNMSVAGLGLAIGEGTKSTFRVFNKNGTNFSPKIYTNGWKGGSRGAIKTLSASKVLNVGGKLLAGYGLYTSGRDLVKGKVSPVRGGTDIGMGLIGMFGGVIGASGSVGYELGKLYGPSQWYGEDNTEWFR